MGEKARRVNARNFALFALVIMTALLYFPINGNPGTAHDLTTSWDKAIPFIPIFAIPYLLILPFFWAVFIYAFWRQKRFTALACSIIGVWLVSYLIYILFQTHVARPAIKGGGFPDNLVRFIYTHDQPYNGLPSLHVAMASLISLYFYYIKSKWLPLVVTFSVLVVASTLFIKQHYLVDVVGGLLLTVGITYTAFKKF